ncbi:MAG: hypothetical protein JO230_10150 [Xanthobacteraceae bacterium]|nr:hypothetical protein [Xanthobacteraceae bacterium]
MRPDNVFTEDDEAERQRERGDQQQQHEEYEHSHKLRSARADTLQLSHHRETVLRQIKSAASSRPAQSGASTYTKIGI